MVLGFDSVSAVGRKNALMYFSVLNNSGTYLADFHFDLATRMVTECSEPKICTYEPLISS